MHTHDYTAVFNEFEKVKTQPLVAEQVAGVQAILVNHHLFVTVTTLAEQQKGAPLSERDKRAEFFKYHGQEVKYDAKIHGVVKHTDACKTHRIISGQNLMDLSQRMVGLAKDLGDHCGEKLIPLIDKVRERAWARVSNAHACM